MPDRTVSFWEDTARDTYARWVRYVTHKTMPRFSGSGTVGLSVVGGLAFTVVWIVVWIVVITVLRPTAHEVHAPGSTPLEARVVQSDKRIPFRETIQPSQSLDAIRCQLWHANHVPPSACPDSAALAAEYFPNLTQTPKTLYIPWQRCSANTISSWDGFSVEYQPSSRTMVIQCYVAEPFFQHQVAGVVAWFPQSLLVVSTASLSAGDITIVENDSIEHLLGIGDRSTVFQLATATI